MALPFCKLRLAVLQLREVVTIDLFQVLHFAKHDKFFLIDDLISLLLEHVVLAELLFTLANLSLFLFAVEALLESINLTLVIVQGVSDSLDTASLLLNIGAMFTDTTFKLLALSALLELNECLLLVDSLALLLDGLFELLARGISICVCISLVLFRVSRRRVFRLLSCVIDRLGGSRTHLLLLHLAEGIRVLLNLSLDRFYVLLCLTILHPDDGEDLANLPQ